MVSINFPAMANLYDKDEEEVVFDSGKDSILSNTPPPKLSEVAF